MNGLQPGGLLQTGQDVPRADLLSPPDVPLGPDLHHLGVGVDNVHGVAIAVAVHQRVQGVQGRPLNTALAQATGVNCLEIQNIDILSDCDPTLMPANRMISSSVRSVIPKVSLINFATSHQIVCPASV